MDGIGLEPTCGRQASNPPIRRNMVLSPAGWRAGILSAPAWLSYARGGIWTRTSLRTHGPKPCLSTISAPWHEIERSYLYQTVHTRLSALWRIYRFATRPKINSNVKVQISKLQLKSKNYKSYENRNIIAYKKLKFYTFCLSDWNGGIPFKSRRDFSTSSKWHRERF